MLMYLERLRGVRLYSALLFSAIVLGEPLAQAANTIDPNSTGATDVVRDPFAGTFTLTNPLADPLYLTGSDLAVGDRASGELRIDDGSIVGSKSAYLGYEFGSTGVATITGAGSRLGNTNYLYVGYFGSGTLTVAEGGLVINSSGYLGRYSDSRAMPRSPAPAPSGSITATSTSAT